MKQFTLLAACLTALLAGVVSAHPGHGAPSRRFDERDLIAPRAVLNGTTGKLENSTNEAAEDHIPIFQTATCVCPPAVCDTRMNAKSQCQCKSQALLACYYKSEGTCPEPAKDMCN